MKDRLQRLEQRHDQLHERTMRTMMKIGLNPETLAPENGLFARIQNAEDDIKKLKDALRGNMTWPGVLAIVMRAGGFIGGLGTIYAILRLFFS